MALQTDNTSNVHQLQKQKTLYRQGRLARNKNSVLFKCAYKSSSGEIKYYAAKTVTDIYSERINKEKDLNTIKEIGKTHTNVIKYIPGYLENDKTITYFMELCDASLEDYIFNIPIIPNTRKSLGKVFPKQYFQTEILDLLYQIALGLEYLHANKVVHGNLKSSNILLFQPIEKRTVAKITDFVPSQKLQENGNCSDIYSYGLLFYLAVTGGEIHPDSHLERMKYTKKEIDAIQDEIKRLGKNKTLSLNHLKDYKYTKEEIVTMEDLIKSFVESDTKQLTAEDVLDHPAFFSAEKKIQFLIQAHKHFEKQEYLSKYFINYVQTQFQGNQKKLEMFDFDQTDLPEYLKVPEYSCADVKSWLGILRQIVENSCVSARHEEFYNDFCTSVDPFSINFEHCLNVFITKFHCELLIQLYKFFKEQQNVNIKFYRRENPSPTTLQQVSVNYITKKNKGRLRNFIV